MSTSAASMSSGLSSSGGSSSSSSSSSSATGTASSSSSTSSSSSSTSSSKVVVPSSTVAAVVAAGWAWLAGVRDALSVHSSLLFFLTSQQVRVRTLQCVVLNGILFLGSIFFMQKVLAPLFSSVLADESNPVLNQMGTWASFTFVSLFQLLLIYPIYCISFILNTIWYQDIADHAFLIRGGHRPNKPITFDRWLRAMAEEVYRILLTVAYLLQMAVCSLVPISFISFILSFVHLCWLYAMYSFEYKWMLEGWNLEKRLLYLERRWAYFAGFGFPSALLTVIFPSFISSGIFALLFPLFIILAIIAKPVVHIPRSNTKERDEDETSTSSTRTTSHYPGRLPIFKFAKIASFRVLDIIHRRNVNQHAKRQ